VLQLVLDSISSCLLSAVPCNFMRLLSEYECLLETQVAQQSGPHLHAFHPGQHSIECTCSLPPHHRPLHCERRNDHLKVQEAGKDHNDEQASNNCENFAGGAVLVSAAEVEGSKEERSDK
jgi:hypothetical protein